MTRSEIKKLLFDLDINENIISISLPYNLNKFTTLFKRIDNKEEYKELKEKLDKFFDIIINDFNFKLDCRINTHLDSRVPAKLKYKNNNPLKDYFLTETKIAKCKIKDNCSKVGLDRLKITLQFLLYKNTIYYRFYYWDYIFDGEQYLPFALAESNSCIGYVIRDKIKNYVLEDFLD